MTTAQEIFETAMGLMDELDDAGRADTGDSREYKNRTLSILNLLQGELYPYSDTYRVEQAGKRPIAARIEDFTMPLGLDDYICRSVLPYGLAAHLVLDENPTLAAYCQQRYEELRATLARGLPAESEEVEDVYGGLGYGEFSRWD